jgi:hypothetical protein
VCPLGANIGFLPLIAKNKRTRHFTNETFPTKLSTGQRTDADNILTFNMTAEIECDFDLNPTDLYLLIIDRAWEGVVYRANFFSKEAKTYVTRKDPTTRLVQWRLLPLHAAILNNAPLQVIESLLDAYPDGSKCQEDLGMLPIHLAVKKHVKEQVLNVLLAANPQCIHVENYHGNTPYQMALTSSSPHQAYYLRALQRGITYSAVTASMSDLLCGVSLDKVTC